MTEKITIAGVPVTVISTEEAERVEFVMCMWVADLPIPSVPAQIRLCCDCGALVWVASSSSRQPKPRCMPCVKAAIEAPPS